MNTPRHVVLIALGVIAGCGGANRAKEQGHHHHPVDERIRLVEIIATGHGCNPSQLVVHPSEKLIVRLRNEGMEPHTIELALPGGKAELAAPVQPQKTAELTLTAPREPGTYVYYCPAGSRRLSMEGRLIVRPAPVVTLVQVASGLTAPVAMVVPPDGSGRRFIVDQIGTIRILGPEGEFLDTPFLDIRNRMVELKADYDERGLLGLAFHPDYARNGRLFLYYSAPLRAGAPGEWNHTSHVSELRVSSHDPNRADLESERILMTVDQPQLNHNGGTLLFGPGDGYLYISLGDGGGAGDQGTGHTPGIGNSQDRENLLGSILRIDVDQEGSSKQLYTIPPDNPFVGQNGRAEIFAYGLRNPYRISFDRQNSTMLLAGDAGQELWEEVSLITRGGNYGWRRLEGTHCFDPESPMNPPPHCEQQGPYGEPLLWPVIEVPNSKQKGGLGSTVIGGYVYRGQAIPDLAGRYIFAMWSQTHGADGQLLAASMQAPHDTDLWPVERVEVANGKQGSVGHFVLGLGEDEHGELYVLTSDSQGPSGTTGAVYRLMAK